MKIAKVQFAPWDKVYFFDPAGFDLNRDDLVVVKTELGLELGVVTGFADLSDSCVDVVRSSSVDEEPVTEKKPVKPIIRKATNNDLEKMPSLEDKQEALEYCRQAVEKYDLQMKLVDAHFSLEGARITFAFIADGRVDFRELVKDLTRHFNKVIRLHQIGIRDEAKLKGDCGHCGRELCCRGFLKNLTSITSDMADVQQLSHRGSERISGICGRLMCCLAYEYEGYHCMSEKMPPVGTRVNVDGKKGVVISQHILKQSVDVRFDSENGENPVISEVPLDKEKRCGSCRSGKK